MLEDIYKGTYHSILDIPEKGLVNIGFKEEVNPVKDENLFHLQVTFALTGNNMFNGEKKVIFQSRSDYSIPIRKDIDAFYFYSILQYSFAAFKDQLSKVDKNNGIPMKGDLRLQSIEHYRELLGALLNLYLQKG